MEIGWPKTVEYTYGDMLAIYCPPQYIPNGEAALDALFYVPITNSSIRSAHVHKLINLRCDYQFVYITLDGPAWRPTAMYSVVTISPVLLQIGKDSPMAAHLEPTANATSLSLHWIQGANCVNTTRHLPYAEWWLANDKESSIKYFANSSTYTRHQLCGPPANIPIQSLWRNPGCFHQVVFDNLKPGARYEYRYGVEGGATLQSSFIAPPGKEQNETRIIFFADMAYNNDPPWRSDKTAERVAADIMGDFGASLVVHGGDLSYSMGWSWAWDHWMTLVTKYAAQAPYAVSAGNHEYDWSHSYSPPWGNFDDDSGGECGVPTAQRFALLRPKFYYSFNHGLFHFVILCTEIDLAPGTPQNVWLHEDLASVQRAQTPWVAIIGHRPPMASYGADEEKNARNVTDHLHRYLAPILEKYQVNLGLWGHFHHYERFEVQNGTTHLIVGTAGADIDVGVVWEKCSVAHISDWGYLRLIATPSAVHGFFILNKSGAVFDQFQL
eukprot:TRINITY_DN10049_c0_g1_i2.p2 TRINITY_DN10049_c0_g1~~TRINITY_DN10049_c0_g1_i2.p2  ORF type:complete len:496 (-),score=39.53 TRINITY_DN10049_c0_g1_i2:91-1578(-)